MKHMYIVPLDCADLLTSDDVEVREAIEAGGERVTLRQLMEKLNISSRQWAWMRVKQLVAKGAAQVIYQ